ncbi:unannotated protein [freshwater metagenome]|uniref:Unannotated protein n=1 Tax=freshwater metagenome TaxID=449393 RepID=A0A6J7I158_9ZZZZ|nr:DUF11 domain-containing protein [Actinomycetota bacterium]
MPSYAVRGTTRWLPAVLLTALLFAGFAVLGVSRASAADSIELSATSTPLSGSTFQGGDGNQRTGIPSSVRDWQDVTGTGSGMRALVDASNPDKQFGGGSKEGTPDEWTFDTSGAEATPSKTNFKVAWSLFEGDTYLHSAFRRQSSTGQAFLAFELNQDVRQWTNGAGALIPCRTTGDLLITYFVDNANPDKISLYVQKWESATTVSAAEAAAGRTNGEGCAKSGTLVSVSVDAALAQGAVNTPTNNLAAAEMQALRNLSGQTTAIKDLIDAGAIDDPLEASTAASCSGTAGWICAGLFGEGSLNLRGLYAGAFGEEACFSFGSMWAHGRSSESSSAALQDYVAPVTARIADCDARIHVRKRVGDNGQYVSGGADWHFTVDGVPSPITVDGTPSGQNMTGTDGTTVFNLGNIPSSGATGTVTIAETQQAGHVFDSGSCKLSTEANGWEDPNGTTIGSFSNGVATLTDLAISRGTDWWCTFNNLLTPDLSVTKTADDASVNAGDGIGFVITTTNAGPGTASGVALGDDLPAGVTWNIASQSDTSDPFDCVITGAPGSQKLACDYGTLAADATRAVHVTATTSFIACSTYDNTATLTASNSPDREDSATVTCLEPATVRIVKDVSNVADDDTQFGFTSTLTPNSGDQSTTFKLAETDSRKVFRVHPGASYVITEDNPLPSGYRLTGASCSATQTNPSLNTNDPTDRKVTTVELAPGADVTCTFTNERLSGGITVVKSPATQDLYLDGTASYSYLVTASGTSDLSDVSVSDDHCSNVTPTSVALLEAGSSTTFTCSVSAATLFGTGTDPITNTATANGTTRGGSTVQDTDTALTRLLTPGIAIAKTGPATATAGALLTYTLNVSNTGNTSFLAGQVRVTDPLCEAPPALVTTNGDTTPEQLDPSDRWTYTCQAQTTVGETQVVNTGLVNGTDTGGKVVTADDQATTVLTAPIIVVSPETAASVPGRARLAGTVGCASSRYAYAAVTGQRITRVTFYVNGHKVKTLRHPNSGSRYLLRYRTKTLRYGTYKVTARVVFATSSLTRAKTLRLQFSRCRPQVIAPRFTG